MSFQPGRAMTSEELMAITREGFERMFNSGEVDFVDDAVAPTAVDHQEPEGTDCRSHLKQVITVFAPRSRTCTSRSTSSWPATSPSRVAQR